MQNIYDSMDDGYDVASIFSIIQRLPTVLTIVYFYGKFTHIG